MLNRKFGRWTVSEFAFSSPNYTKFYKCLCDCGTIKVISAKDLKSGGSTSCGCFKKEKATTHGMSKTRTYTTWVDIKRRCYNPNDQYYSNYGGRGVVMCERWKDSFDNFLCDMGEKPIGLEIDRIDTDGPYSPNNCRWVTKQENTRNRRCSIFITFDNKTLHIQDWVAITGIRYENLKYRIKHMTVEDALTKPYRFKNKTTREGATI